ncbi:MAG TPA: biotin/lipoyl-binding protein [Defluviitoga sp.]|nr:biotin/lipoyl-binding protein [Defluviitoga sp.]HOP23789.1 biotin/lipoyl-binding protein [Defluviitoga sp.]HPZ28464.1 biotin/lipoyl-binding protein [Defluviitoga sp.]HQD62802.1 biotin/lipoyl-binding protein [Defluviitoga sp.]
MKKKFKVTINNKTYEVEVEEVGSDFASNKDMSQPVLTSRLEENANIKSVEKKKKKEAKKRKEKDIPTKEVTQLSTEKASSSETAKEVKAPLPGIIIDICVSEGQNVSIGDTLLIIEAMKMENEIPSEYSGLVEKIYVKKGDTVEGDQVLMLIK